jgi:hypothetical protein
VVTALIDNYFSDTGLLFPYLHEESFRNTYAQLKSNAVAISRTWLGLLNMVLAIATHTSTSPISDAEIRSEKAGQFYRQANSLCNDHVMNGASLEIGMNNRGHPFTIPGYHFLQSSLGSRELASHVLISEIQFNTCFW